MLIVEVIPHSSIAFPRKIASKVGRNGLLICNLSELSEESTLAQAVLGLDVRLHIPVQLILPLVVLLVLAGSNLPHLLVVVVVQLVIRALLLAQVYVEVLIQVVPLNTGLYALLFQQFLWSLGEGEAGLRSRALRLDDLADGCVEGLCFGEGLVRLGVAEVDCTADLVDAGGSLHGKRVTL